MNALAERARTKRTGGRALTERRRLRTFALVAALALGGCAQAPAPDASAVADALDRDGQAQWRGMLACADCDGIDTLLVLERAGARRRYTLVEAYLAPDGARFVETGRWQRESGLLRLRADGGGQRVYAPAADGGLEHRDARGRRLAGAAADDALMPARP